MAATYEPITTTTLGSSQTSITFSSISSSYTDLRLVTSGINGNNMALRFNNDSGSSYSITTLYGSSGSASTYSITNNDSIPQANSNSPGNNIPYLIITDIFSYAGNKYKSVLINYSNDKNGTSNGASSVERTVGLWRNTAAINSITLFSPVASFAAGTVITLYGLKAA